MVKVSGKWLGTCMIFSFLSYGIGMGLMEVINKPALQPLQVLEQRNKIITGGILVTVFHSLFNMVWLVVMYGRLAIFHQMLSRFYLGAGLIATVMLAIGGVSMLLPVSLSNSAGNEQLWFSAFVIWSSAINFYAYQTGMFIWGIGGLAFCYLLNRSHFAPSVFPVWGSIGYLIFITGTILELFGIPAGVVLSIPAGLFEIALSVWIIKNGFAKTDTV
jgi:hypothetical protein